MWVNLVHRRRAPGRRSSSTVRRYLSSFADDSPHDRSIATRRQAGYAIHILFAVLVALSSVLPKAATAQEPILDAEAYHRAVDFCRQQSWPGFTLDPNKHILFAATIPAHLDVTEAKQLSQDYEAYPENQEEVDAMARRLRIRTKVIYDP